MVWNIVQIDYNENRLDYVNVIICDHFGYCIPRGDILDGKYWLARANKIYSQYLEPGGSILIIILCVNGIFEKLLVGLQIGWNMEYSIICYDIVYGIERYFWILWR